MAKTPRGIYRTRRPPGIEDDAWVEDGTLAFDVPESRYRAKQYEPEWEKLPWKEDDPNT